MSMRDRFRACLLLHAAGDAMGYKNGKWEFNFSSEDIHSDLVKLGGIDELKLKPNDWIVSDDTILHLAVAESLIETRNLEPSNNEVYFNLVDHYKRAMKDMKDRAPGNTCISTISKLSKKQPFGFRIPFNPRGGGCGVSMRSSVIGLRYHKPEQKQNLIEYAVESGRMTHHNPMGYLGGVAAALLTSYAIQDLPIKSWGRKFLDDVELAKNYVKTTDHATKDNLNSWNIFINSWLNYLKVRNIEDGVSEPVFPPNYGVNERDSFYKTISPSKHNWAGANGLDSVLIAYDGLLGCNGDWRELCLRAMLHGGDNDSTGSIAGSFYGALYGFDGVNPNNYKYLEYEKRLVECADLIFEISTA